MSHAIATGPQGEAALRGSRLQRLVVLIAAVQVQRAMNDSDHPEAAYQASVSTSTSWPMVCIPSEAMPEGVHQQALLWPGLSALRHLAHVHEHDFPDVAV
jgi:hypothetical protein